MTSNKLKKIILILAALPMTTYAVNGMHPGNKSSGNAPGTAESASSSKYKTNNSTSAIGSDKVILNFENADIQSVIKAISQLSGKNFVIDPRVKGTINIVSDKPIAKVESYKVLEAALRMQGFATVEADGVIKVLPEADAKTYGMRTETAFDGGRTDNKHQQGDQVMTKIFVIQHGSAMQLANSLRPLIAPNNSIAVYPNSNALIITDYASNIVRIGKIINQLSEVNSGIVTQPTIVTLQNSVAADVAQILQSYLNGGGSAGAASGSSSSTAGGSTDGPGTTITVEATTNSIIIYSPIKDKLEELKELALKVDRNTGNVNNNLHVVYLKNADANHVADVLRAVVNGQENADLTATSSQSKFTTEPTAMFGSTGSSGSSPGGASGSGAARTSSSTNKGGANANNANQKDQPKILVQAEPTTNSLIIQAPQAVYKNLRMIIDMLDVRRAQVMIEAMIANINTTEQGTFGIQWLVGAGNNNAGTLALTNYGGTSTGGGSDSLTGLATSVIGATGAASGAGGAGGLSLPGEVYVGLVTGTTTIGGQTIPTLGALADMLAANSAGNVLERPTMITLDNEEARIMVGSNIGIPNGSYQNTAAQAGNLVTTITRQDLGTVLQIKPLITQNGTIQLDIWQEDSLLDPNQPVSAVANGPSFIKRNMRATIMVDDGQIIALGGMTSDTITIAQNGVPGLSEIPYIGWLFSWQSRSHNKQNLVLFLRPVVIKNADGYKALTNQRYNYIVGQQNRVQAKGNLVLPELKPVTMDNQLPYSTTQSLPGQSDPSLNMNKDLPVVDLTHDGANVSKSNPAAISVTNKVVAPTVPTDSTNHQLVVTPVGSTANAVIGTPETQINSLTPGS